MEKNINSQCSDETANIGNKECQHDLGQVERVRKIIEPKTKQFGGKTEFVLDYSTPEALEASKRERHFYQRMLRAYLKGKEYFYFGYVYRYGNRYPQEHKVLVKWV